MLSRPISFLSAAIVLAFAACGGNPESSNQAGAEFNPCVGDGCWNCQAVTIKSTTKVVCESDNAPSDVTSYDCAPGERSVACPPELTATALTNDAVNTDSGSTYENDYVVVISDAGVGIGTGTGDSGGGTSDSGGSPESVADAGIKTDSGTSGGGYHCEVVDGKTTCESTPTSCTCDAGTGSDSGVKADSGTSTDSGNLGCTLTQGYWKNHAAKWPVSSLTLGGVSYTKTQLLAIFNMPSTGDASLILAHQLIAAKLNVLSGSSSGPIGSTIAAADAWLAAHPDADGRLAFGTAPSSAAGQQAVALSQKLDAYNNGLSGVPHCK